MANNTIEILTSINKSVSTIAEYLAPKNGSGKEATAKLSKGTLASTDDIDASKTIKNGGNSLKDAAKMIGGLPESVSAMAALSGRTIRKFRNAVEDIIDVLVEIDSAKIDMKKVENFMLSVALISKLGSVPDALKSMGKIKEKSVKSFKNVMEILTEIMIDISKNSKDIKPKDVENYISNAKAIANLNKTLAKSALFAPIALMGAIMTYPVVLAYIGIFRMIGALSGGDQIAKNVKGFTDSIKPLTRMMIESVLLVGVCLALGALVMAGGSKLILYGIGVLGATLLTMTAIIGIAGFAGKLLKDVGAMNGVKEIMLLTMASIGLVAICIALGAILSLGDNQKILINGLLVLGGTLVTLGVIILLTGLLSKVIKDVGAMKGVKDIILMTFGAMAIIIASKFLGDFVIENYERILIGLGSTIGVMLALIGVAFVAGKALNAAKKGIIALGVIELLAFGAMGVMLAVTKLSKEIEEVGWDQLGYTVLSVTGIIVLFGGLAAAASFIMPEIILGSVALGLALLMAYGAVELTGSILDLSKKKEEYGTSWEQLAKDVIGINGVIAAFGLTAAAFSLLTIPITLALPAMALTIGFAKEVVSVVNSVIDITKKMDEIEGGSARVVKLLNEDIRNIMKSFKKENFDMPLSTIQAGILAAKFAVISKLAGSLLDTTEFVSKIAKVGGMVENGKLRPIKKIDKDTGEITYGDPVDVPAVADVICSSMKVFIENMQYGFEDLKKMMVSAAMFEVLGTITTPITKFVEMLTGYVGEGSGDNYTLAPVRIKEDGSVDVGKAVPVKQTAEAIVSAVSAFVATLYSKENAETWSEYVYGNRTGWQEFWGKTNTKTKAVNEIGGMLGVFISPVCEFINAISKFTSSGLGKLTPVTIDSNGNPVEGKEIDVTLIAQTIGGSISTFISEVYKMDDIQDFDKKTEQLNAVVGQLSSVSKMMADLSKNKDIDTDRLTKIYNNFEAGGKSIRRVAASVSIFDKTLFNESKKRKQMIEELGESIENMMSKFKDDDDSIRNLANLISSLETMDAEKISNAIGLIKGAAKYSGSGNSYSNAFNNIFGGSKSENNEPPKPSLTKEDIIDAISSAMDGLYIQGGTDSQEESLDSGINTIIGALKSLKMEININKGSQ